MVNFVVPRDFGDGLDFFDQRQISKAKAKATKFGLKALALALRINITAPVKVLHNQNKQSRKTTQK